MSTSETSADCLKQAASVLESALLDPEKISSEALQNILCQAVRLYAVKAQDGFYPPFPRKSEVTSTDVMIMATDMLHALNLQVFELSMWQAMSGSTVSPEHRS